MKRLLTATILAIWATSATAQNCAPYADLMGALSADGAVLRNSGAIALSSGEIGAMQTWEGAQGQWIIIAVLPNGVACPVMAGSEFFEPTRL